jgi:hypothetical protein
MCEMQTLPQDLRFVPARPLRISSHFNTSREFGEAKVLHDAVSLMSKVHVPSFPVLKTS